MRRRATRAEWLLYQAQYFRARLDQLRALGFDRDIAGLELRPLSFDALLDRYDRRIAVLQVIVRCERWEW